MPLLAEAIAWYQAGYMPLPVKPDGSKAPAVSTWTQYQKERPSLPEIIELFKIDSDGIGLLCGAVSGGLEMFELEGRAMREGFMPRLEQAFIDHDMGMLLNRLANGYVEHTPGGGTHFYYRVKGHPKRNTRLARRPATKEELAEDPKEKFKVLIETRAEGGFTVIAPSAGRTHLAGAYTIVLGGLQGIPTITEDERDAIHVIASTLDEMPVQEPPPPSRGVLTDVSNGLRPGDDFNVRGSWDEILVGWVRHKHYGKNLYGWRRPGKRSPGISATTGREEIDRLYVFSTSTEFEAERPYTKFAAYALLNFEGDFSAAARDLRARSYGGDPPSPKVSTPSPTPPPTDGTSAVNPEPAQEADAGDWRRLQITPATSIEMEATEWLWEENGCHWIPRGQLALLGGREGVGKTTMAYTIAAHVTRGTLHGSGYGKPQSVIISATEDSWKRTVKPRLAACGADMERIFKIEAATPEGLENVSLPEDTAWLKRLVREYDVALIILDPLMSVINAKHDTHRDAEVRKALEPVVQVAEETNAALIGLIHQKKGTEGDLRQRLMASVAFVAVARSVLYCARRILTELEEEMSAEESIDPNVPTYWFGQIKNNLQATVDKSHYYRICSATVGYDDRLNMPITSSRLEILGTQDGYVEDLVLAEEKQARADKAGSRQQECAAWIRGYLREHGEVMKTQVAEAAKLEGFSNSTVERSKGLAGVVAKQIAGPKNKVSWALPERVENVEKVEILENLDSVQDLTSVTPVTESGKIFNFPKKSTPPRVTKLKPESQGLVDGSSGVVADLCRVCLKPLDQPSDDEDCHDIHPPAPGS